MSTVSVGALESHSPRGPEGGDPEAPEKAIAGRSPLQLAMARLRKDKLTMISVVIVGLYILAAILAPILTKVGIIDPLSKNQDLLNTELGGIPKGALGGIGWPHILGVEPGLGRDVFARVLLGTTTSLTIALTATILTISIGTVLGIISGFSGGAVDMVIGRMIDLVLSFPLTLMLLALSGVAVALLVSTFHVPAGDMANGTYLVLVLALFGWPPIARIIRGQVISIREREFVDAAVLMGASKRRIYFKEMLPNLWAPLLVYFTLTMPAYISAEAALSYLGVGIKPPTPTLGNILTDSINYSTADPVFFFVPAAAIAIIVVAFNLLGDGLRDALDPTSAR